MKKASFLLETILSITILSVVVTYSFLLYLDISKVYNNKTTIINRDLDLLNLYLFIDKKISDYNYTIYNDTIIFEDSSKISLREECVYFDTWTLMESISSFEVSKSSEKLFINICDLNSRCEEWSF